MALNEADRDRPTADQARLVQGVTITAMSLLILVLLYVILRELAQILRPLLIAVFVGYLIVPVHHWLVRRRIPPMVSYFLIAGTFLGAIAGLSSLAYRGVDQLSTELPTYIEDLENTVHDYTDRLKDKLHIRHVEVADVEGALAESGATDVVPTASDSVEQSEAGAIEAKPTKPSKPRVSLISSERLIDIGRSVLETSLGSATGAIVVLFYLIFLLAESTSLDQRVAYAFGKDRGSEIMRVVSTINIAIAKYLAVKTLLSFVTAFLSFVVLSLFGVKYAVLWAILTFFANFIPYIGSMVAVVLPIAMCFVQFQDTLYKPIIVLILLISLQQVIGSVVEPRLVGRKLGVSPLVILLSLAFWGMLWGVPGMIFSAPLAVTIKIILENIEQTRPLAKLCSNVD